MTVAGSIHARVDVGLRCQSSVISLQHPVCIEHPAAKGKKAGAWSWSRLRTPSRFLKCFCMDMNAFYDQQATFTNRRRCQVITWLTAAWYGLSAAILPQIALDALSSASLPVSADSNIGCPCAPTEESCCCSTRERSGDDRYSIMNPCGSESGKGIAIGPNDVTPFPWAELTPSADLEPLVILPISLGFAAVSAILDPPAKIPISSSLI